ncbi:MAG: TrkH family potassium uptake protein [Candidatus Gastranaerophilales bacterium]|nr:TrkH family potassium uptake protein [Candidatus Gastranaerophilales bacterium]
MNFNYVFNTVSLILKYIAVVMLVPCICGLIYQEYTHCQPFIYASSLAYLLGILLKGNQKSGEEVNNINKSETLAITLLVWILFAILASIPFLFFGLNPVDALFEAVSGVTTTGATILTNFSEYPKAMFFWRSFSQWLGGMGILVLFIAILPKFAIAGRQMFYAESPGASSTESKLTPRIRQTAGALWGIYFVLTIIEIFTLKCMGMPTFDAICNSLSSLSGGGFSPAQNSIMDYGQAKFFWVIAIFMFLSGMNFALQYKLYIKRNFQVLIKDDEFKLYFLVVLFFTLSIAITLTTHNVYEFKKAIEAAFFQVISIVTTTGFASVDYNEWNLRAKLLLFLLMFCGASIGSASGGLKLLRIVFIFKYLKRQISKIFHPNGVYPIKINKVIVNEDIVKQMISFVIFYYTIFAISAVLLVFIEQNVVIGLTSAIATLGNVGPAFGQLGPMGSYADLNILSKFICMFNMLIGRLELIPFLALLHPDFWSFRKIKNLHKNKKI